MRDYEGLARDAIQAGHEGPKIDFKERVDFNSKKDVVDLAKLVLAMANTDSDEFNDLGIIIIGARRKELVGGCDLFGDDSFCASVPTRLNRYIDPEARIEAKGFHDPDKGWFGAIIVKPTRTVRPHCIAKEFTDEKRVVIRRNECYVRRGESVELASRSDFDRIYTQRFGAELDRLRDLADPEPLPHLIWDAADPQGIVEVPPRGLYSAPSAEDPFSPEEIESFPAEFRPKAEAFNEARRLYVDALGNAGPQLEAAQHAEYHSNWLRVTLVNQGEAPLFKVLCFVTAPTGFHLYGGNSLPTPPKLLPLPVKPRFSPVPRTSLRVFETIDRLNDLYRVGLHTEFGGAREYLNPRLALRDPLEGGFRSDGERKVAAWADRLKHGLTLRWDDPVVLVPPAAEGLYSLDYVIHADNLRRPKSGRLEVRVRPGAARHNRPIGDAEDA